MLLRSNESFDKLRANSFQCLDKCWHNCKTRYHTKQLRLVSIEHGMKKKIKQKQNKNKNKTFNSQTDIHWNTITHMLTQNILLTFNLFFFYNRLHCFHYCSYRKRRNFSTTIGKIGCEDFFYVQNKRNCYLIRKIQYCGVFFL